MDYLGINVADTPAEAKAFLDDYEWSWPQLRDPRRERAKRLGATYQPHFILVDADGGIVATWEGAGDAGTWEAMLAKLP